MATALKAAKREGTGKYVSFNLRKEGRIPGVIYGKGMTENINVSVVLKEFLQLLKANERIIDLDIDGKTTHVLLKAVQHGTYDHEILHADFRAISDNEEVEIVLEIELHGEAPGAKVGGMIEQNLHQVTARCMPKNMPEKVMLDISNLNMGDILYVADLPELPGVKYMMHGNPAVVSCHAPRGEEAPAEGEAAAAPEVIGEKDREAKD
ncbi:MAG: 50S ribosomal protein L25 [Planctomycetaceae bacterium]|nr:50S ribosomal protein L25 [Planctomycetaceae bacterium]